MDLDKLEELINSGLKLKDVSKEMCVSLSTIKRRINKMGLNSLFYSTKKENITCLNCSNKFESLIVDKRKFCSSSCSAIFNNSNKVKKIKINKKRIFKEKNLGTCINCNIEIIRKDGRSKAKYCSVRCQHEFGMNQRICSGKASLKTLKLYLIKKHGNRCMDCGWCEINKKTNKVPIELEHIDGNSKNNILENLKLLCPNCHSLTPTYKALNRGNGRHSRMERYKSEKSY